MAKPIVATTEQAEAAAAKNRTEVAPAETTAVGCGKKKESKDRKAKKEGDANKSRNPPTHPPYLQMITEAITTLKGKSGSSKPPIQKFIEANHNNLPPNFRKLLLRNLNKLVASGRLVQVKASYKLPFAKTTVKPPAAKPKKAAAAAPAKKAKAVAVASSSTFQGSGDHDDSDGSDSLEKRQDHTAKSKDNGTDSDYSDVEQDFFHSDLQLLKMVERPRAVDMLNGREAYQICVDRDPSNYGFLKKSLCLKLLKEIGCEDCFLCLSVDLRTVFFASLNANEASRLEDDKRVLYAAPCRTIVYDI